jgi:hypothetical protein
LELADRLDASEFLDDEDFRAYGLTDDRIAVVRRWAVEWRDDICSPDRIRGRK